MHNGVIDIDGQMGWQIERDESAAGKAYTIYDDDGEEHYWIDADIMEA